VKLLIFAQELKFIGFVANQYKY